MSIASYNTPTGRVSFGWIGESFAIFKRDAGTWIAAVFILFSLFAINIAITVNTYAVDIRAIQLHETSVASTPFSPLAFLGGIVVYCLEIFFSAGLFIMANKAVRNEPVQLGTLFTGGPLFLSFFVYRILFALTCVHGYIACCVGVFFAVSLVAPGFAIIADGDSIGSAFSRSFDAMKNDIWNGALFVFVFDMLLIVSAFPLFLGLFVTGPMTYIIIALAYRDMIPPKPNYVSGAPTGSWPPSPPTEPPQGSWPPPPNQDFGQAPSANDPRTEPDGPTSAD
jgi:uncharacterized membrane protein